MVWPLLHRIEALKDFADSEKSGREYERIVKYVESILADEEKKKNKD